MKLLKRLKSGILPNEMLDWHIARERMLTAEMDFAFRVTEITLICGGVVYIEKTLGVAPISSSILAGFAAIYARSRATAGMLELLKTHEFSPRRQQILYWVIQVITLLVFLGIIALTQIVVPLIANVQS